MAFGIGGRRLALAGLLVVAAVSLSQCRLVNDRLTGVDLRNTPGLSAYSDCIRACNEGFKVCTLAEDEVHKANLAACAVLGSSSEQKQCKKDELTRHQQAHLACVGAKNACKDECYDEGGGSAGL